MKKSKKIGFSFHQIEFFYTKLIYNEIKFDEYLNVFFFCKCNLIRIEMKLMIAVSNSAKKPGKKNTKD